MPDIPWYAYALVGAVFVGLAGTLEKKVLARDEPVHFSITSSALIGLMSLPFLPFVAWGSLQGGALLALYGLSLLSLASFFLVAFALKRLEAGELSLLLAFSPAVTAAAAFAILGEALSAQAVAGIALIVSGLVALEASHARGVVAALRRNGRMLALAATLAAVALYAAGSLADRVLLAGYGVRPLDLIVVTQAFTLANVLAASALFFRKGLAAALPLRGELPGILGFTLLLFVARVCYAFSVAGAFVGLAVALKRVSVAITICSAGAYLHERGVARKLLVAALVIAGGALLVA